jgi:hypothetical protein
MLILTRPVLTNLITVGYPWPVLTNWLWLFVFSQNIKISIWN